MYLSFLCTLISCIISIDLLGLCSYTMSMRLNGQRVPRGMASIFPGRRPCPCCYESINCSLPATECWLYFLTVLFPLILAGLVLFSRYHATAVAVTLHRLPIRMPSSSPSSIHFLTVYLETPPSLLPASSSVSSSVSGIIAIIIPSCYIDYTFIRFTKL